MGQAIGEALSEKNIGFQTTRALLWAGLVWESPALTLEEAGEMIDAVPESEAEPSTTGRFQYVLERVMIAQGVDQAQAKKKDRRKKAS